MTTALGFDTPRAAELNVSPSPEGRHNHVNPFGTAGRQCREAEARPPGARSARLATPVAGHRGEASNTPRTPASWRAGRDAQVVGAAAMSPPS